MNQVYGSSAIKRHRRGKAEIEAIHLAIHAVLEQDNPQSVRHVYYRLAGQFVDKTEAGYRTVQHQLLKLREDGVVPWDWVSDGTRWRRQNQSFDSKAQAVAYVAEIYRRDLWMRTPAYVEVWCESDSMAGVLIEETDRYNVPLMVSRGFSSRTFLYSSARAIGRQTRPAYLYYIGDWDPSGVLIPEKIEQALREFAPESEIHFERIAITPDLIEAYDLPTKPAKRTTHAKYFRGGTVEAEALPAHVTRELLRNAIERHLDPDEVRVMEVAEESERQDLFNLASQLYGEAQ